MMHVIEQDLGISIEDDGPWRGLYLSTEGENLVELVLNATITEVDQDGGDHNVHCLEDANSKVQRVVSLLISEKLGHRQ